MRLKKVKDAVHRITVSKYYEKEPEKNIGEWKKVFCSDNPIHIEIGMGKGDFIIEMAKQSPDINYIGIEMYDSVMVKAVEKLKNEEKLQNLKLILLDAQRINEVFDGEISRIYLNFSDPWPKSRHVKRRLTSKEFLDRYDKIFIENNEIFQKTDNENLFDFSIMSLTENGYTLKNVTRDLYAENINGNVMTEYEKKFVAQGIKIKRLEAYKI